MSRSTQIYIYIYPNPTTRSSPSTLYPGAGPCNHHDWNCFDLSDARKVVLRRGRIGGLKPSVFRPRPTEGQLVGELSKQWAECIQCPARSRCSEFQLSLRCWCSVYAGTNHQDVDMCTLGGKMTGKVGVANEGSEVIYTLH